MQNYPTIPTLSQAPLGVNVRVFDKIDGVQIRALWTRSKGFDRFGTRKRLLTEDEPASAAVPIIMDLSDSIGDRLKTTPWSIITCFFELAGSESFAGDLGSPPYSATLFDVCDHKAHFMDPEYFIETFDGCSIPSLLLSGLLTEEFITSVRDGSCPGMSFEGAVIKAHKPARAGFRALKVKNRAWYEKRKALRKEND